MKNLVKFIFLSILLFLSEILLSRSSKPNTNYLEYCTRPTATHVMRVNNVKARLTNNGNLFSKNLGCGYETHTGIQPNVSAINEAGIWMGGKDKSGNIKVSAAAQTTNGYDFFAGPLDINGATEKFICDQWDKIFNVKGNNIRQYIKSYKIAKENGTTLSCNEIPDDVLYWPAQGNPYFEEKYGWQLPDQPMAGYADIDQNGYYDPCFGDFPVLYGDNCNQMEQLIPTEINYFIINDNGGTQKHTQPPSLQVEFHVNAYAYSTKNALNDMTFYQYKLINKSSEDLLDCYFAWWVDPELGCYNDDYFGCDPGLGMAYIYNADAMDGNENPCFGNNAYINDIPALGFDFVKGPWVTKNFKKNVAGSIAYDENGSKILIATPIQSTTYDTLVREQMSSFIYSENNANSNNIESNFYQSMQGYWADGTPLTYGGTGFNPETKDTVKYAFPHYPNDIQGWSMCTALLPYADRSFLMSVGPTIMQSGQTNDFTMAIFTVDDINYPCPDLSKLYYTDKLVQDFFDNCANDLLVMDAPDAPEIQGSEMSNQLELTLFNEPTSNNYLEKFNVQIFNVEPGLDSQYRFEGYKLYQLKHRKVNFDQLNDESLAIEIAQSDIKNEVDTLYNYYLKLEPSTLGNTYKWIPKLAVIGQNQGLQHIINITKDAFTNERLINGREYHFAAVAYATNNWRNFDSIFETGQKKTYLTGSTNFKVGTFVPRYDINNDQIKPAITRISGEGNPNVFLEMDESMYDKIFNQNFDGKIKYLPDQGPLLIRVTDPDKAKGGNYRLQIDGSFLSDNGNICQYDESTTWNLINLNNNSMELENASLYEINEYSKSELGFTILWHNFPDPANLVYEKNGGIGAKLTYRHHNGVDWFNAIKVGGIYQEGLPPIKAYDFVSDGYFKQGVNQDPTQILSKLGDGFFVPFLSTRWKQDLELPYYLSPSARNVMEYITATNTTSLRYRDLNNVDIVFTNDKSKWSKCIVVETAFDDQLWNGLATIGNAKNFELRASPSIDQFGNIIPNSSGFSYFPGYAIDVETGKRLNIFFGENSIYAGENAKFLEGNNPIGGDMIFNPTFEVISTKLDTSSQDQKLLALVAGGQHYIYVTRMEYDGCVSFATKLKKPNANQGPSLNNKAKVASAVTWTSFVLPKQSLLTLDKGLIPNDLLVQLRVSHPYSPSRIYDIEKERNCTSDTDHPVYEFGFEDFESNVAADNTLSRVSLSPNPAISSHGQLKLVLNGLPEHSLVQVLDQNGQAKWQSRGDAGEIIQYIGPDVTTTSFDMNGVGLQTGLYLIKITDTLTGESKSLKWIVF